MRARPTGPRALSFAAIGVAVLLLTGCGGDIDPEPDATDPAEEASVDEDATDEQDVVDEADDEEFFTAVPQQPVRVVYEADSEDFDRLIISVDPPRTAIIFDQGRMIDDGEGSLIFCSEEDGETFCMRTETEQVGAMAGMMLGSLFSVQDAIEAGDVAGVAISSRETIAGRDAVCFVAPDHLLEAGVERGEVCVDDDLGIVLRWAGVDEFGEHRVEATEVGDPDPAEFEPPVEPQQMPGG